MGEEQEKIIIEALDDIQLEEKALQDVIRVLAFSLDEENYCIEITQAKEVFSPGLITRVPNAPVFVKGVTNLHGAIIPLVDIRGFLGLALAEIKEGVKVITSEIRGSLVGVVVDRIFEAREIEKKLIQPPLATLKGKISEFTIGQIESERRITALLDLRKILESEGFSSSNKGGT